MAGRNRLENEGAKALSTLFEVSLHYAPVCVCRTLTGVQTLGTLVQVSMPQNGINADGVRALAKAFSKNPNLEVQW